MDESETSLLRRFQSNGDGDAFAQITRLYAGMVYGTCVRITGDREAAADATQDTFFALLRSAGKVTGSLGGWLHRVATRRAIDLVRLDSSRRQREQGYTAQMALETDHWADVAPLLDEAMNEMDEAARDLILRHFLQGQTTVQLAATHGVAQSTISRHLEQALAQLRDKLQTKGVLVAVVTLGTLMSQAAQAAPPIVVAELSRMAIVGSATAGSGAGATTLGGLNLKTVLLAVGGVVLCAVLWLILRTGPLAASSGLPRDTPNPVATPAARTAQAGGPRGRLIFRGSITREDLRAVTSVSVSADGRHLYTAAFEANTIGAFRRDAETGGLEHLQTIEDRRDLNGVTCLRLSPDGRYAVTAAFRSRAVALFSRDAESGELEVLSAVRDGDEAVAGLAHPIQGIFSPEGKHIYVLDGWGGGVTTLAFGEDRQLQWLHTLPAEGGPLAGSRGSVFLPDGQTLVVAGHVGNAVSVLARNPATGELTIRQSVRDETEGIHALAGVFGVDCSVDGKFVYACSGLFQGDHSVVVFQVTDSGGLAVLQEFTDQLHPFRGGNCILVSPDGRNVYATATGSGSVACFERDRTDGSLRHIETLADDPNRVDLKGASGICCSPDGRFVYVAALHERAVAVYERLVEEQGETSRQSGGSQDASATFVSFPTSTRRDDQVKSAPEMSEHSLPREPQ